MEKYLRNYWPAVLIIVVGLAIWYATKNSDTTTGTEQNNDTQIQEEIKPEPTPTMSAQGNVWEGKLSVSNDSTKGNYILTTSDHVIYLRTSRDFSGLVGKDVKVNYSGNLMSFVLKDIVAK